MIISGKEIANRIGDSIKIEPYLESRLNPNSYNLTLHNELLTYDCTQIDMAKDNEFNIITIPEEGYILKPNILYLARTIEYTETNGLVPMIEGRSSIGRLGLFVHITAGFGDVGFKGYWTLELSCIQPIRIYAGVEICQIFYHTIEGLYDPYVGKYTNNTSIQSSKLYIELTDKVR